MIQTDSAKRQAYPLQWPPLKPRAQRRTTNRNFKTSFAKSRDLCLAEIRRLEGTEMVVSTNIPLKKGTDVPYAVEWGKTIPDPGVAVYFKRKGKEMCFACDCYNHVQDNMHAIALTINALRGIARWGTGDMMEAAFRGFTAIPEKTGGTSWWDILGVPVNASAEMIKRAYRDKAFDRHPDQGGSNEAMAELNQAYRLALDQNGRNDQRRTRLESFGKRTWKRSTLNRCRTFKCARPNRHFMPVRFRFWACLTAWRNSRTRRQKWNWANWFWKRKCSWLAAGASWPGRASMAGAGSSSAIRHLHRAFGFIS